MDNHWKRSEDCAGHLATPKILKTGHYTVERPPYACSQFSYPRANETQKVAYYANYIRARWSLPLVRKRNDAKGVSR